jgi:hypothetical protein
MRLVTAVAQESRFQSSTVLIVPFALLVEEIIALRTPSVRPRVRFSRGVGKPFLMWAGKQMIADVGRISWSVNLAVQFVHGRLAHDTVWVERWL